MKPEFEKRIEEEKGIVLYESLEEGTREAVTFAQPLQDGDLIEIWYEHKQTSVTNRLDRRTTGKIPYQPACPIVLETVNYSSGINLLQVGYSTIKLTATGITRVTDHLFEFGSSTSHRDAKVTYITKVIAYRSDKEDV